MPRGNLSIINNVQKHRAGIESAKNLARDLSVKVIQVKHKKMLVFLKKLDSKFNEVNLLREKMKQCLA